MLLVGRTEKDANMGKQSSVTAFIEKIEHPLKAEIGAVRSIIISSHPEITETVRWGGPSFEHTRPLVSINPRVKDYVALIFHDPGELAEQFPILEPGPKGRAYLKLRSMHDVKRTEAQLVDLICRLVSNG